MRVLSSTLGLILAACLVVAPASGATVVMDFSPFPGLGIGVGTTQTITQNGVRMQCLSGKYEITGNPQHELNLKDFSGTDGTRIVQFDMVSGLPFDFLSLSRQDASGPATITSNLGGSTTFNLVTPLDFSCPQWKGVSWIRVTVAGAFSEFKFNSFTFDTTAHPATFACCNSTTAVCTISPGACPPGSTSAPCASSCTPTPCPIPNNPCAGATRIGNGTHMFSTTGATTDGPTEANLGFTLGDLQINQDVWFLYTASCTGTTSVNLCGSNYDSKVAIYSATCPSTPSTAIAGNDDAPGVCGSGSLRSFTTFASTAGTSYLIRVGGFQSGTGNAVMIVSCAAGGACCQGAACTTVIGAAACTGGGTYLGDGVACSPVARGGNVNACCKADFNNAGGTTVQDIFAFLTAWFAGCS